MIILLLLWLLVVCVAGIVLAKNDATLKVRLKFIDSDDYPEGYLRLPSYDEMLFHPKHWTRWTYAQWADYIKK